MSFASVSNFVKYLSQSPLLQSYQCDELTRSLGKRHADVRDLARELIRRDWLTPYQINQLLQGKGDDLVLGNYILFERLGEGGMGKVYKARHKNLDRVVALKILRSSLLQNEIAVKRFQREMRAASQLDHPNIVRALDADIINDCHYLAMEFIDGIDLSRLVKRDGPLKVHQACDFVRQAALGLAHAQEQGLVHRDIKPANLLLAKGLEKKHQGNSIFQRPFLGRWGILKILDMGLARILPNGDFQSGTELTQMGVVMGTPDYIAPEQARDSKLTDVRSDLYSLGCTLYYLLAGQVPFPLGTVTEKLLHHQLDEPEPVEEVRRSQLLARGVDPREVKYLSSRVGELVRQLMAKRPQDRLQTPMELVEVITDLLSPAKLAANGLTSKQTPLPVVRKQSPASKIPVSSQPVQDSPQTGDTQPIMAVEVMGETPVLAQTGAPKMKGGFWRRLFGMAR
jgi:serine/threonine protein kinase